MYWILNMEVIDDLTKAALLVPWEQKMQLKFFKNELEV